MTLPKSLHEVCSASLPMASLAALADMRCMPGITLSATQDRAWVRWPAGDERILERLLAVCGVELFARREGGWSRHGSLLPAGELPLDQNGQQLANVLTPAPAAPMPPGAWTIQPLRLRLVRSNDFRETSALRCRAAELLTWSERVPSGRLSELRGARSGDQLLLLGPRLPEVSSAERFWGESLLLPLGWRSEPDLPQHGCRELLGLAAEEMLIFTEAGSDVLSQADFRPLTRARLKQMAARL